MKRMLMRLFCRLGLLALCIYLGSILWNDWNREYPAKRQLLAGALHGEQTGEPGIAPPGKVAKEELKPLAEYAMITRRPLFNEDRRPYIESKPVVEVKKPDKKKPVGDAKKKQIVKLSAVIITEDKRIALVQAGGERQLQKIMQGEEVNGWILTDVQPSYITLNMGDETMNVELEIKASPAIPKTAKQKKKPAKSTPKTVRKPVDKKQTGQSGTIE
ncbi:MAG: hypothetical protein V3R68_08570 [Gammaproteobacteria bacterium]